MGRGNARLLCKLDGCDEEVFVDKSTQTVQAFCSRRHAREASFIGQAPRRDSPGHVKLCQLHGCDEEVFIDKTNQTVHDFCSRSHAREAASTGQAPRRDSTGHVKLCQLDGCDKKVFVDGSTQPVHDFCSRSHAREAAFIGQALCQDTRGTTSSTLSVLPDSHRSYASLEDQFLSKWQKGANDLRVERIFKIEVSKDVHQKHANFAKGKSNTRRRFHGTSCCSECTYFVDMVGAPCQRQDCSVCGICTRGFQLEGHIGRTAQATNTKLRYGEGLYFSSVSGKANDYAKNSEKILNGRRWRCIFAANVVVGRAFTTEEAELPGHMCPPHGYDAVVGQKGANLNYDEVVVYDEAAAIPTFLIVYSTA